MKPSSKTLPYPKAYQPRFAGAFCVLCFFGLFPLNATANPSYQWVAEYSLLGFSEASALYQMSNDWKDSPSRRGRHVFNRERVFLGYRTEHLNLGFIERSDSNFTFSPDTARLVYLYESDQPLPPGEPLDLYLKARHFEARGLNLGLRSSAWKGWTVQADFQLLHGTNSQQGHLAGRISESSPKNYTGDAQLNYYYHKDRLLRHDIPEPSGQGYALDLGATWQGDRLLLHWQLQDVLFDFHWYDLPYTLGELETDRTAFDSQGYISYRPLFSGVRGTQDRTQPKPPLYSHLLAHYQFNDTWTLKAGVTRYWHYTLPEARIAYTFNSNHTALAGFETYTQKYLLGYSYQQPLIELNFMLGTDHPQLTYTKSLQTELMIHIKFM